MAKPLYTKQEWKKFQERKRLESYRYGGSVIGAITGGGIGGLTAFGMGMPGLVASPALIGGGVMTGHAIGGLVGIKVGGQAAKKRR